jgi:non-specific serine/threonine protein kinase
MQHALSRPEGKERTLARAKALNGIGFMYWADTYPTDRRSELEEALNIAEEFGDQWNIATALRNFGLLANLQGNYLEARSLFEQSLGIWRELGFDGETGAAWTLTFLGDAAVNLHEATQARSCFEEAISLWQAHGDINFLALAVRRLGQLAWQAAEYEVAGTQCIESLNLNLKIGDRRGVIACLAGFAAIALRQGNLPRAAQVISVVETQLSSLGIRLLQVDQMEYEHNLALLRAELDEKTLTKFWAKGKAMSLDDAIAFALQET